MATAISKKICLLGDFATGKTSLVRRFVYELFDDRYISTIGVKVSRKTVAIPRDDDIVELTLMLWDLAGSDEFDRVRASYLRGASGAVLVCDLTRLETVDSLQFYARELRAASPDAQLILAANKVDLIDPYRPESQSALSLERVQAVAARLGTPVHLTSAKTGNEVEALFRRLGRHLVG